MSKAEREVVSLSYDSDEDKPADKGRTKAECDDDSDEEAPPLEDDGNSAPAGGEANVGTKCI